MNETRVNELKSPFEGLLPNPLVPYSNQEIVDILCRIQKVQMNGVYEQTHAEHMRDRDLLLHISTLVNEYGLKDTETFKRFEANMKEMGYTIGSFIKGINGERIAKRDLKLISFDKNVKILYNIALEDGDAQAEYDAIVIAPYGIFMVEVKNWSVQMHIDENGILERADQSFKYNLPGRMSIKEGLLRECAGELFPEKCYGILLFPDESAVIKDDYRKIPVCFGGGVVYKIREFDDDIERLTTDQIQKITERILSAHKEQKALCKVKCSEIVEDYAVLMAAIEEASDGVFTSVEELKNGEVMKTEMEVEDAENKEIKAPTLLTKEGATKQQEVKKTVYEIVSILVAFGAGLMTAKAVNKR